MLFVPDPTLCFLAKFYLSLKIEMKDLPLPGSLPWPSVLMYMTLGSHSPMGTRNQKRHNT